jgi:hypothetical protein
MIRLAHPYSHYTLMIRLAHSHSQYTFTLFNFNNFEITQALNP